MKIGTYQADRDELRHRYPSVPLDFIPCDSDWIDRLASDRFGGEGRALRRIWRDPLGEVGRLAFAIGVAT